jgi:hypothetical protein
LGGVVSRRRSHNSSEASTKPSGPFILTRSNIFTEQADAAYITQKADIKQIMVYILSKGA